jgi:hypothetical protein
MNKELEDIWRALIALQSNDIAILERLEKLEKRQ